nr:hypothetical protein [Tanacetum cinerariifolium]
MSAKRIAWNEFSSSMASAIICLATDALSSHNTKYPSLALTQKAFANMRMIGRIAELDADEDVTLVDVDTVVEMDANTQGRMDEDVTAVKEVNDVESTVFDDEEMVKRLQDEEIEQAVARENRRKKI